MYPLAAKILAKRPIWSFLLHCACPRGARFVQIPYIICVDTLHHLCRVCFERPLFKGILYSRKTLLCHIDSFQRLILFRIMFLIKGGIYTNNVPPFATKILAKQPIWSFPLHCACSRGARSVQIPYIICVGCVLRDLFFKAYYIHEMHPLCHI